MEERLHTYLLGGALPLATLPTPFWRGFSVAVLALALIEFWSGWQFANRYRDLQERLPALLARHPARYRAEELERCGRLEQQYARQRTVVLLFLVLGITLALLGGVVQARPLTMGMGYGLCLQGAILLVLDLAAQWRNGIYYQQVDHFNPTA